MIDWNRIRLDYLRGTESLREIADRHGVAHGTVLARAHADGWNSERNKTQANAYETARNDIEKSLSRQLRHASDHEVEIIGKLRTLLDDTLTHTRDVRDLKTASQALETLQRSLRIALGVPQIPASVQTINAHSDLRSLSTAQLFDSLLSSPSLRLRMVEAGIDPSSMSDGELLRWIQENREGGSKEHE